MIWLAVQLIGLTDHPRSLCSTSVPIFGLARSEEESGSAKMVPARATTLSLTMALEKPIGDVIETASHVLYSLWYKQKNKD